MILQTLHVDVERQLGEPANRPVGSGQSNGMEGSTTYIGSLPESHTLSASCQRDGSGAASGPTESEKSGFVESFTGNFASTIA